MLFSNLIKENQKIWDAYLHHDFVRGILKRTCNYP